MNKEQEIKKLKRDWQAMIKVSHDFFHAWRQMMEEEVDDRRARFLTERFWEKIAISNAEMYRGDKTDISKILRFMARMSDVMGETVTTDSKNGESYLIHIACPWIDSFKEYEAKNRCQAGCDCWFETTLKLINPDLKMQTLDCLTEGGKGCIRKFTNKKKQE